MSGAQPRQERSKRRREQLVEAAADLIRTHGVDAVSHRAIARQAGLPLASTTYYFSDLDQLLAEAGAVLTNAWIRHAVSLVDTVRGGAFADTRWCANREERNARARILVQAILPGTSDAEHRNHYERLVTTGHRPSLAAGIGQQRPALDQAIAELLVLLGLDTAMTPALAIALVDGAGVSAMSEASDLQTRAEELVQEYLVLITRQRNNVQCEGDRTTPVDPRFS